MTTPQRTKAPARSPRARQPALQSTAREPQMDVPTAREARVLDPPPPPSPTAAAGRKAALRARSGIERARAEPDPAAAYPIGKSRKQLRGISIYMHPLAKETLDKIARDQGRTVQDLGLEALNLLFRHYGERPIA